METLMMSKGDEWGFIFNSSADWGKRFYRKVVLHYKARESFNTEQPHEAYHTSLLSVDSTHTAVFDRWSDGLELTA